jgi:hypothetical protein
MDEYIFKTHDRIKVVRKVPRDYPDQVRMCDLYAGYIGSIKKYSKGDNSALVLFDSINGNRFMKIDIKFLEILYD